jgi:hypothetical protein
VWLTRPAPAWRLRTTGSFVKFSTWPPIGLESGREKYRMERLKHELLFVLLRFCSSDDIVLILVIIVAIHNPPVVS